MYFLSQLPAVSVSFGFYPVFAKSGVYCLPNIGLSYSCVSPYLHKETKYLILK